MKGVLGFATIRLTTKVHGLELQVLIGGGSFDSFIQPRIAKFLNLPMEPAPGFRVMVGNFDVMDVEGRIPSFQVEVQGQTLDIPNVYVLQVAGGDLVIGSSWLKTLKAHIADYDSLFIRFLHKGEFVTLKGDVKMALTQAQFHHIRIWMHIDAVAEIYSLQLSDTSIKPPFDWD